MTPKWSGSACGHLVHLALIYGNVYKCTTQSILKAIFLLVTSNNDSGQCEISCTEHTKQHFGNIDQCAQFYMKMLLAITAPGVNL